MKVQATKWVERLSLLGLITFAGCGGQPAVVAPPVATNPYGYGYSGNCAGAVGGGQPLSQGPLNATLTDNNGTVIGSIQLYLYLTGQFTASDPYPSIVGSGSIAVTDPSILYGQYAYSGGQQTSFCISSQDPTGGGMLTGVYGQGDASIAIAMKGIVSMPSVNPMNGYPTGAGVNQPITISIGYDCLTQLSGNTRFQGCVRIDMGGGTGMVVWAD